MLNCVICSKPITEGQMVWLNDHPSHYPDCPTKSYSEQMEEQLEPRPDSRPWDDTGKHQEIHEHTQD